MYSIERIESLLTSSEETLAKYQTLLKNHPNSLFNKGMVKNTEERITELRSNLIFEKKKREKEVIDLRLKGKVARVGKLPLELLGGFSKLLSDCLIEASRKFQYGNKSGSKILSQVKNTIDLRFDRLIPGSTHILVTGNTSPDLFGNSMIENALVNTFQILNTAEASDLIHKSELYGGSGIKKLNEMLMLSLKNDLEFDLQWYAPNDTFYKWEGNKEKMNQLSNSISKIQIDEPQEIEFTGTLIMQSLKGFIEIQEEEKKAMKVSFPMELLEKIKGLQIGDQCSGILIQRMFKNSITNEEKISFELKEIN